jgi:signal transduction histidine kinase
VWLLIGMPSTLPLVVLVLVSMALGFGLAPLFLGLPLLAGTLLATRNLGTMYRGLARGLLGVEVAAPLPVRMAPGLAGWFKARIGDRAAWRALGYLLLRVPLSSVTFSLAGAAILYGLGFSCYPLYWIATGGHVLPLFDIHTQTWVMSLPLGVFGGLILASLPWLLRGLTAADRLLVVTLLGPVGLSERVRDLEKSRAHAIEDATARLRRIERDLHDGAQVQLVSLAMKLGIARDELEGADADVAQVRQLVNAAHGNAKQALIELRDLARGIRPPALDAGLEVALSTLAARSAVEVRLRVDLPERPSPAMETLVYFSAAELVTNAAKHGGDTLVHVEVTESAGMLHLIVSDSGAGGARISPGGGLAGLVDRVGTVDGRLEIDSPQGGPTTIALRLPLGG